VGDTRLLCELIGSTQPLNLTQKCDAKRPCTTCLKARGVSECIYDSEKLPQSAGVYPVRRTGGHSSGQDNGDGSPVDITTLTPPHPPAKRSPTASNSDTAEAVTHELPTPQMLEAGQDQVSHGRSSELVRVRRNSSGRRVSQDSNPSISAFSSFLLPTIPPEPWVPLSLLEAERLQAQTSLMTAEDLDLRRYALEYEFSVTNSPSDISRLWVFLRLPKLGTQFSRKKLDVLLRGDHSGAELNSWFVRGPEGLGLPFLKGFGDAPAMLRFYARRVQSGWEGLAELFKESDYKTRVQASILVAAGNVLIRLPQTALLYIRKSCDFIKAGNLQFVPTYGRPPEFSEDLHETLVALSQTIYWANYMFLVCDGPEPHATAELEKEFRQELPVCGLTFHLLHIQLISATGSLSDSFQNLPPDDANTRYLACQGRGFPPRRPPCQQ